MVDHVFKSFKSLFTFFSNLFCFFKKLLVFEDHITMSFESTVEEGLCVVDIFLVLDGQKKDIEKLVYLYKVKRPI